MTMLPAPMSTPASDLKKMPMMFIDIVALQNSETWALADGWEAKACLNLWMRAWHQVPAGSLPNNEKVLEAFAAVPDCKAVRAVALRGFVLCSDGRLYHPTICARVVAAMGKSEKAAKSANHRWENEKQDHANALPRRRRKISRNRKETDSSKTTLAVIEGGGRKSGWPDDFEKQFWDRYPRKVAKDAAMRMLRRVERSCSVGWAEFVAGLDRYIEYATMRGDPQFVKHPSTWLNAGCWADELQTGRPMPTSGPPTGSRGSGPGGKTSFGDIARMSLAQMGADR